MTAESSDTSALRRALKSANHRLQQIFLANPLAMIEADVHGTIRRWNPSAQRIFGWTAGEAVGQNIVELLASNSAREHMETVIAALLGGSAANSRHQNVTKDGRSIICQWYNIVLYDEQGRITGWLSQVEDITEQLRAAEQLAQSEAYLKAIFGAMNDIVMVIDADGVYCDIAPTQPELRYRYSERLVGRRMEEVIGPERAAHYLAQIREVLATGQPRQDYFTFDSSRGERHFYGSLTRLYDDRVLWVAHDITDQRKAEAALAALREEIIQAQQAALRELSTPIVPISDRVIAMPLIGAVDSTRAQQVLEALLAGVVEHHAATAILDITGVQVVDTYVANTLLRAAHGVKLLGAEVVITGIRPEIAHTLVSLGLDLRGIVTLATLQSGIAYALKRQQRA